MTQKMPNENDHAEHKENYCKDFGVPRIGESDLYATYFVLFFALARFHFASSFTMCERGTEITARNLLPNIEVALVLIPFEFQTDAPQP